MRKRHDSRPAGRSWPAASRWRRAALLSLTGALLVLATGRAPLQADSLDTADSDTTLTGTIKLVDPSANEVLPAPPEPFRRGESLRFSVQYGFINAGSAYLEVPAITDYEGHPVYTLVARAESNAFFSRFYKVRNRIESLWDTSGRFSRRYTENRSEGGHKEKNEILFDHDRGEAIYKNGDAFPIPPGVQDALSSFYYTRTQALPLGGSVYFDYHASHRSQPLEVRVLGRERVKTPAGTFDCVAIQPLLKAGGVFSNKGKLVIWLTDDERRMPVLMRSKVSIGSVSVVLQEAKPGI